MKGSVSFVSCAYFEKQKTCKEQGENQRESIRSTQSNLEKGVTAPTEVVVMKTGGPSLRTLISQ